MIVVQYAAIGTHRLDLVDGVIASSPLVNIVARPSAPIIATLKVLAEIIPSFQMKFDLGAENMSRDPEEVRKYEEDPLIHPYLGLGGGKYFVLLSLSCARMFVFIYVRTSRWKEKEEDVSRTI